MAVGESDQIDDLLQLIVDTTTDVLDADRATLFLREDDKLVSRVKQGHEFTRIIVELGRGTDTSVVPRVPTSPAAHRHNPRAARDAGRGGLHDALPSRISRPVHRRGRP